MKNHGIINADCSDLVASDAYMITTDNHTFIVYAGYWGDAIDLVREYCDNNNIINITDESIHIRHL